MCTSVQVKTGAIARLCKCAQGNIGKNINGHRILLISAVQGPLAELLYLSLFVCLFVGCPAMVTLDQISTFFQYILALKPYDNPVPLNTKQYQDIQNKYQPVPLCTDPVLSNINQHHPILTQYHQVPTNTTPN